MDFQTPHMNREGLGCCVPLCRLSTLQDYLVERISRSSNPLAELCTMVWSYICLKERNIIFLFSQRHLRRGCFFSNPHKGTIWLVALGGVVWPNCDIPLSGDRPQKIQGSSPPGLCAGSEQRQFLLTAKGSHSIGASGASQVAPESKGFTVGSLASQAIPRLLGIGPSHSFKQCGRDGILHQPCTGSDSLCMCDISFMFQL